MHGAVFMSKYGTAHDHQNNGGNIFFWCIRVTTRVIKSIGNKKIKNFNESLYGLIETVGDMEEPNIN